MRLSRTWFFLWDEAWFGFARFSPFLRPRTAMGAANDIEAWMRETKAVAASIGQLFSLYAINAAAKGEKTRQASGTLYTTHSRTVNDMIQYVLYHRAFQS